MSPVDKVQFRKCWLAGLAVGLLALAASGCGSSSSKANTSTSPTSGGTVAPGSGTKVTVGETEYKLALSTDSFTAGAYTFTAVNNGKIVHALEIDGPGVHAATGDLEPGQSASLSVELQPGKYDVFCPIPGHKALGMNAEITVAAGSAGSGSGGGAPPTTAPPTTAAPTTAPPTTAPPTTAVPTTAVPTTAVPTTAPPTTKSGSSGYGY